MDLANLFDPLSLLVVAGGTAMATVLRCGLADTGTALAALGRLGRRRFDSRRVRGELAEHVRDVRQDGLLRARERHLGDAEIDEATDALIGKRSVAALVASHQAHRAERVGHGERAVRTLLIGADLAPVFGLAGTLLSLTQLQQPDLAHGDYGAAIGMAVLSTLYGLLLSHLALAPLARLIERTCLAEDMARQQLIEWLAAQVEQAAPRRLPPRPVAVS